MRFLLSGIFSVKSAPVSFIGLFDAVTVGGVHDHTRTSADFSLHDVKAEIFGSGGNKNWFISSTYNGRLFFVRNEDELKGILGRGMGGGGMQVRNK